MDIQYPPMRDNDIDLSVVIPIYNEQDNLMPLYERLTTALTQLNHTYEVIAIDDGSRDESFTRLEEIHAHDPRWQIIRFRRNFGQTAGLSAGFDTAQGRIIVTIDADLQNDPHDIAKLIEKIEDGYDIVSGWRIDRKESFVTRRLPSVMANWLISRVTGVKLHDYGCTLKAYDHEVVKKLRLYGELHRFIPAIASQVGVRVAEVPVRDHPRTHGESHYGLSRTFRVILDLLIVIFLLSYFQRPLRVFGGLGILTSSLGFVLGTYLTIVKLFYGEPIGDRPLLILAVLLIFLGVQLISTGLLAEMILRTYYETQQKPSYFVRDYLVHRQGGETGDAT